MTPLPCFSALVAGRWSNPGSWIADLPQEQRILRREDWVLFDGILSTLSRAERFRLPLIYGDASKVDESLAIVHSCPPSKLPYPVTWIETGTADVSMGVLVIQGGPEERTTALGFLLDAGRVLGPWEEIQFANVDPWKGFIRFGYQEQEACYTLMPYVRMPNRPDKEIAVWGSACAGIIAYLCAMLDCKNVETVQRTGPPRQGRRGKSKPGLRYRSLIVRSSDRKRVIADLDPARDIERGVPLHTVRGHFKTYTADRPLLGHAVGRFWFPSHVRGSQEHGAVIKDYEVSA